MTAADEKSIKLFLDSRTKAAGTNAGECVIDIGDAYSNIKAVAFNRVSFLTSWFNVSGDVNRVNNRFTIIPDSSVPATTFLITITPGYYTATELAAEIQAQIRLIPGEAAFLVTYNAVTNTYKFDNTKDGTAGPANQFVLDFLTGFPNNAFRMLGFDGTTYASSALNPSTLSSTTWAQIAPRYITISIDELGVKSWTNTTGSRRNSLMIPIPVNVGLITEWIPSQFEGIINLDYNEIVGQFLTFIWRDSEGRILNFNGSNWEMSICLIKDADRNGSN